jgi:hypothetical protein
MMRLKIDVNWPRDSGAELPFGSAPGTKNATGNTVPPIDDAKDMIPDAVDCHLFNQWAMILVIGPYRHETYVATPPRDG